MRWLTRKLPGVIYFNNTGIPFVLLSRFVALHWCSLTGMAPFSNRGHGRWQILRFESCRAPFLRQLSQLGVVCGPVRSGPLRCGPFEDTRVRFRPGPGPVSSPHSQCRSRSRLGIGWARPSGLFQCPVVYSGAQWFISGFFQWFIRVPTVFGERALGFFKRINFLK